MGGAGGNSPHPVPDWRSYKAEGIPELDNLQRRLAARGLRDPWIRNEVWRFKNPDAGLTPLRIATKLLFRGFGIASGLMVLTIACDKMFNTKKGHGHH